MKLATTYLGFKLRTPLVPSASPLSQNSDNIKRMEDAGASAVVFHSLFEEQLRREHHELQYYLEQGTESYRSLSLSPSRRFQVSPEHVSIAKARPQSMSQSSGASTIDLRRLDETRSSRTGGADALG